MPRRFGQRFRQRLSRFFLKVEEGHARAVIGKSLHERLADAAGAAADQHDAVLEALVFRKTHAISRSVCGSNRQIVRVSTEKLAGRPIGSLISGATRARRRTPAIRIRTIVSAPVGSLTSTSASIRVAGITAARLPPSEMHSGRMPRTISRST